MCTDQQDKAEKACTGNASAVLAQWIQTALSFVGMCPRGQKEQ